MGESTKLFLQPPVILVPAILTVSFLWKLSYIVAHTSEAVKTGLWTGLDFGLGYVT